MVFVEVLWIHDTGRVELGNSIEHASSKGVVEHTRARFEEAEGLTPELRNALVQAFWARRAIRSVNDLATRADRDRRTISEAWTRCVGPAPAIRLKELLDMILLMRAIHRRHHGQRWSRIARDLGMNSDVLRRRAKARLGKPLNELTIEDAILIDKHLERFLAGEEARWPLGGGGAED